MVDMFTIKAGVTHKQAYRDALTLANDNGIHIWEVTPDSDKKVGWKNRIYAVGTTPLTELCRFKGGRNLLKEMCKFIHSKWIMEQQMEWESETEISEE